MYPIHLLIEAFRNISFYLLGAGASANVVPMTYQLKNKLTKDQMMLGSFNLEPIPQDELTHRIIGETTSEDFFLCRISPSYVIANAIHQLAKHHWQNIEYCPQYDVFYYAKKPSTIFTANLDGLAERHQHHHHVHHFHGIIPKYFGSDDYFNRIQDHFSFYNSMAINLGNILFIQKESFDIANKTPYKLASIGYKKSKYLIIIGYSFGKNEFGLDDAYTYDYMFKELFNTNRIPILIIAPDTYELKYRIQDTIKSTNVYGLNMHWDCLSKALISYFINLNQHDIKNPKHIVEKYYYWEDLK